MPQVMLPMIVEDERKLMPQNVQREQGFRGTKGGNLRKCVFCDVAIWTLGSAAMPESSRCHISISGLDAMTGPVTAGAAQ
ncbi:hypothetical protein DOU54_10665 [Agrobacterium sp. MS2]|nr:hypothetical protein DOU54_10665 [Agrobacterium sp. MS2]